MSHTVSGVTTPYTWDVAAGPPVVLQDGTHTYVYGLDLISTTDNTGVQTYHLYDGLGSTTGLVDGSGKSVASYDYDVFGAIRSQTGSSPNEFTFTGEQVDDTGLQYLRARYYDPSIGRFLTRDSVGGSVALPQSLNRYCYTVNDPVNLVDPWGLCAHGVISIGSTVLAYIDALTGPFSPPWLEYGSAAGTEAAILLSDSPNDIKTGASIANAINLVIGLGGGGLLPLVLPVLASPWGWLAVGSYAAVVIGAELALTSIPVLALETRCGS
jgi:RHS repeat-associated protein